MKVYIVEEIHYETSTIIAVFSSAEQAEAFVKNPDNKEKYYDLGWDEYEVDALPQ